MSSQSFTLKEIAELTGSLLVGPPHLLISGVDELEAATPTDLSFLSNPLYAKKVASSKAGAILIKALPEENPTQNFLVHTDPSLAFQKVIDLFLPPRPLTGFPQIHPTAVVHESATLGENVTLGPYAVVEMGASVGDHTTLGAHSFLGAYAKVGNQCYIHPNVVIREESLLGDRVIIQPGAIIGSCGFGYITNEKGEHQALRQVGYVIIEDDVEIGANTTIDRARFKVTKIGKGTKIDNLVQIGHQVTVGGHNLIVAQSGLAGSSRTGDHVVLAGQTALVGHISLESGVILTGRAAASKSLPRGIYSGAPAVPLKEHNKHSAYIRKLPELAERLQKLTARCEALEKNLLEKNLETHSEAT